MTKKDCCFTSKNNWFRYRSAAVIIEDDCILFAKSENEADDYYYSVGGSVHLGEKADYAILREVYEDNSYTTTSMGTYKENMYWLPICELKQYKAFPSFFAEELLIMPQTVKHIITNERK